MAKKEAAPKKIKREDVVKAVVESLKKTATLGGAKVTKVKVEDGSKVFFQLDNGFTARARVKAGKTK